MCKANNANKAIQATIFAYIVRGGIERITKHLSGHTILSIAEVRDILSGVKESLRECIGLYTESQNNASKKNVKRYAYTQFTQLDNIVHIDEINNNKSNGLSKFIVTPKMKTLHKTVINVDPSGKILH